MLEKKSRMCFIDKKQVQVIKNRLNEDKTAFIAEINGSECLFLSDYLEKIGEIFKFPIRSSESLDGYLDWMRDLQWLNKDEYILIIYDFEKFLSMDSKGRRNVLEDFQDTIFPWWDHEVTKYMMGGKSKPFSLYLVI